jgi:hypothetical protein
MAMGGLAAIQLVTPPTLLDADVLLRLASVTVALVVLPLRLSPPVTAIMLACTLVAQVVYELPAHEQHAGSSDLELGGDEQELAQVPVPDDA